MKIKITIDKFLCQRCGHTWIPRDERNVRICPKCKSARFDEPKKSKKEKV